MISTAEPHACVSFFCYSEEHCAASLPSRRETWGCGHCQEQLASSRKFVKNKGLFDIAGRPECKNRHRTMSWTGVVATAHPGGGGRGSGKDGEDGVRGEGGGGRNPEPSDPGLPILGKHENSKLEPETQTRDPAAGQGRLALVPGALSPLVSRFSYKLVHLKARSPLPLAAPQKKPAYHEEGT